MDLITLMMALKARGAAAGVYKFEGSVDTYNDLPTTGVKAGAVYNVLDTDMNYAAVINDDELSWDVLGTTVDLSNYYTKTEVDSKIPTAGNHITIDTDNKINSYAVEAEYNTAEKLVLDSGKEHTQEEMFKDAYLYGSSRDIIFITNTFDSYWVKNATRTINGITLEQSSYTDHATSSSYSEPVTNGLYAGFLGFTRIQNGYQLEVYSKKYYSSYGSGSWSTWNPKWNISNLDFRATVKKNCSFSVIATESSYTTTACTYNIYINENLVSNADKYTVSQGDTLRIVFSGGIGTCTSSDSTTEYKKVVPFSFTLVEIADPRYIKEIELDEVTYKIKDTEARTSLANMQPKLTAGDNITISDTNVISASKGSLIYDETEQCVKLT